MQVVGGLLGFPYFGALLWLGFRHDPYWIPATFAFAGVLLSFMIKPGLNMHLQRYALSFVVQLYVLHTIVASVTFGIGWGIGALV